MMVYQIRAVQPGDAQAIAAVAVDSWQSTYESIYPSPVIDEFVSSAYAIESLTASIHRDSQRADRLFHVAVNTAGDVVAFSHVIPYPKLDTSYELARIYARSDTVGTGAGFALLRHLLDSVPTLTELSAWVEQDNATGRKFYERHGFKVVSEKEDDLYGHRTVLLKYRLVRGDEVKGGKKGPSLNS